MVTGHDIVVIDAEHNELTLAGYLIKAGLDLCVVESQDKVGGSNMSRELIFGFKYDWTSHFHETIGENTVIENY